MESNPTSSSVRRSRDLSSFERAQLLTAESSPFNLVIGLGVEGTLAEESLRAALGHLQLTHPLLAARLIGKPATARFELGGVPPIPLRALRRTPETNWIAAVEAELSTGFDRQSGPLMRCILLGPERAGGRQDIILTFHHVIVDAASAFSIIHDLLGLCGTETPATRPPPSAELPPSADSLFPGRYRGVSRAWASCRFLAREMADELAYRWRTRAHPARPHPGKARCRALPLALSESETETLVRATRIRRLTLNTALNAALLVALVRRRYPGTTLPHRYFLFPTLRPHLEPPVPAHCDGSYLTTLRLTVTASDSSDVWALAAEIQDQVGQAGERGDKFLAALFSPLSMKLVLAQSARRMGTIGLSYTGARPFEERHGDLRLTGLHAFVSNLPIGPEYTAQARIFRGRLWLDILYLDVDMSEDQAQTIADELRTVLTEATASARQPAARGNA